MATSRRTLGSGRTLGAAKPAAIESLAARETNQNLLSPSDSTVSLHSQTSSSAAPRAVAEDNDISSAATREAVAINSASNRLFCPICNEEMVTLLQLNRHLDSDHQDLENQEQDEVQTWFKSQVAKAKKFQPLAVLNQKLKGLDMFEPNEDSTASHPHQASRGQPASGTATPEPARRDPDDVVRRDHWQRHTRDGLCSDPLCDRRLGVTNGNINCRSCGKLFCEEHSMYQMKLSRSAQWEPVRGYWCRVCETCFKSREGYNDHMGFERDHIKEFSSIRRKAVDKAYLDVSRLEKRLTKLTQLLSDPAVHEDKGLVNYLWSWSSGAPNQRRQIEQSIVDWEDDASVTNCPFCMQEFSTYTFKRHHCRLCGRVVCDDPATQCSTEVPLAVAGAPQPQHQQQSKDLSEKDSQQLAIDIRMCQKCKRTVFSKADFDRQLAEDPPDQRAFRNLKEFERGIRAMLPRFQKLLTTLQDPEDPPSQPQLQEASRVRKRLTDSFNQYTMASRRIRDLPTTSPTQIRLQKQIYAQASQFLHIHMLPMKSVPKMLKHASSSASSTSGQPHHSHSRSRSSQINGHLSPAPDQPASNGHRGTHSPAPSHDSSSALSSLEDEEKLMRERLILLEEQKVNVAEMRADARRRRRMDEVESLNRNLEDLARESETLQRALEGLNREFEGLYLADSSATTATAPTGASWMNARNWTLSANNGV